MFVIRREDVYQDMAGIWRYSAFSAELLMINRVVPAEVLEVLTVSYDALAQGAARWLEDRSRTD